MIVLPWPGPSACRAPKPKAASIETSATRGVSLQVTRPANSPLDPLPAGEAVPSAVEAADPAEPAPGAKDRVAVVTSSGLVRRSCGYERSSSLTEASGTLEPESATPSPLRAVTSFHPIRSA